MKANLPKPVHESYRQHRRDLAWKIILPVAASSLICLLLVVLVYLATFRGNGDVARWAEISTIWLSIPTIIFMLIFLALLVGIIYLLTRLLSILPNYTIMAQDFFYKVKGYARRGADAAAKPIIFVDTIGAGINRFFGRQ